MALTFILFIVVLFILFRKLFYKKRSNEMIPDEDSPSDTEPSADSSTSSSSSVGGEYEVFLSFRGKDTRTGFTDYLYTSLVGAGIRTFRDDNKLRIGEEIGPDLLQAIDESKILIPILSKNYAASKWCMIELAKMVEFHENEGNIIFPIFYDVVPSHVRNQKGNYEKPFRQHKKFGEVTAQKWREAMTVVGKLKGLELKKASNGHEGELVKMIVKEVILMLKKNYTTLPDDLVGMDHHVSKLETLLDVKNDGTRIIGILGMGGIGKTTISKVVFNRLCDSFDGCCFLDDVRERLKHHKGVVTLQSKLVSKITKQEHISISDAGEGISKIKDVVNKKKVLIVLDDIDAISQVNQLFGDCLNFYQGSKIMITTRNKDVLDIIEKTCLNKGFLDVYECYKPRLMNDDQSLTLFSGYAFKQKFPPQEYAVLCDDVVSLASGLPLVLVTLGSLLFGVHDQTIWEDNVKKLKKIPNKDVLEKLRISFDALDHGQQQMFLDIACFPSGGDKRYASYMWDACGYYPKSGLDTLIRRSLVTVGYFNELWMHDQLIDLGRQIVREENLKEGGVRSRVYDLEEALHVLKEGLESNNLEALQICHNDVDPLHFVRQDFLRLHNLRYLVLENAELDGDFTGLFPKLRFLAWIRSGGEFIPTNLCLKNLVTLELSIDKFMDAREGWSLLEARITQARMLKSLVLETCNSIKKLSLSTFEDLEILEIWNCNSLWEVAGLSKTKRLKEAIFHGCNSLPDIQGLEKLEVLEVLRVESSISIIRLPDQSKLKVLKRLHLKSLINLREIGGIEKLKSLESLIILCCTSLGALFNLSHLTCLKHLKLSVCSVTKVKCLGLVLLENLELSGCKQHKHTLESLSILGCNSIKRLSNCADLINLRHLSLTVCSQLTDATLRGLRSLEMLELSKCGLHDNKVDSVCISSGIITRKLLKFSHLTNSKELVYFTDCEKLVEIRNGLISLERLTCYSVGNTLDVSSYSKHLKKLKVCESENLKEIRGLEEPNSLEVLDISNCPSLEKLSDLSNLSNLKALYALNCKVLRVAGLHSLVSLQFLHLSGNRNTYRTLDLSIFKCLKEVIISYPYVLTEIKGLGELKSLEKLWIYNCFCLEKLSDLSILTNLRDFKLRGCISLSEIKGLNRLVSLVYLEISFFDLMEKATMDFSSLTNLIELYISGPKHLTKITGLEKSKSLQVLNVSECRLLKKLSDLSNLTNLRDLKLRGCSSLSEIKGLNSLVSLVYLEISSFDLMKKSTMHFSSLTNLMELNLSGLKHLTKITGLEKSNSLQVLNLSGCILLERLPNLSNINNMTLLNVRGCKKLPKIDGLCSSVLIEDVSRRWYDDRPLVTVRAPGTPQPRKDICSSKGYVRSMSYQKIKMTCPLFRENAMQRLHTDALRRGFFDCSRES